MHTYYLIKLKFKECCRGDIVIKQETQTTEAPETTATTTETLTTPAPTTGAPTTGAPTTGAPTTGAPTTAAPTTAAPTTAAPTTAAPTTVAPTTAAPTTGAPTTAAPTTAAPTTAAPTTVAPITAAPTTAAPTKEAPTTPTPTTEAPTTAISFGCPDVNYNTEDENKRVGAQWRSDVKTWEACSQLCQQRSDCKYWTWHHGKSGSWAYKCVTMQNAGTRVYNNDTISGQRNCREGEDPTTPTPTTEAPTTAAPTTVTPTTTAITTAAPTKTVTTTGPTTTTTTKCDSGWMPFHQTGKCYRYFNNKTSWTSSLHLCSNSTKNPTATLASIPNQATNKFLSTLTEAETWTGGYQKSSGEWAWTDGSAWTYSSWHRLQPDGQIGEDFLETNWAGDGLWNDEPGNKPHGFLCQYDPTPTGCFKAGDYFGADLNGGKRGGVTSPENCQKLCQV